MSHSSSLRIKRSKRVYEVVILGGGFAGVYCARAIAKALGRKLRFTRIAIISKENYKVFRVPSDPAAVSPLGAQRSKKRLALSTKPSRMGEFFSPRVSANSRSLSS